jgi:putative flippase GtrA
MVRFPRAARFMRYAVSSAAASATSAITLAALYLAGVAAAVATVAAFCAGALVSFVISRFWAWRHSLRREATAIARNLAGYIAVVVTTALIATGAAVITDHATRQAGFAANTRALLIEVAYFGAFAVTFVAKFLVLDRYVFAGSERRSRAQVDRTTPV